jgi:hypothetical protein
VEGVERKVFDVGRELPFGSFTEGSDLDIVEAFHVNVPNTNVITTFRLVRSQSDPSYHRSKTGCGRAKYRARMIR